MLDNSTKRIYNKGKLFNLKNFYKRRMQNEKHNNGTKRWL